MIKIKEKYIEFVEHCLENKNLEGICSLKDFCAMDKQIKKDFGLSPAQKKHLSNIFGMHV